MATRPVTNPHARLTRHRLVVLTLAVATAFAVAVPVGISAASPSSSSTLSLSDVQSRVDALNTQVERIAESYDTVQTRLTTLKRQEVITNRLLARDLRTMAVAQREVAASVVDAYRVGPPDTTLSLVASASSATFADETSSLSEVARSQANQMAAANAAQRSVAGAQAIHNAQIQAQRKALAAIADQKSQIEGLLSQEQQVESRLKASARARLAREQTAVQTHEVSQRASYTPPPSYSGAASGRASAAIQFAYAQLGKPYQWAGAGLSTYDCSGLTMRSWGAAGVGLPHSAAGQQAELPSVSLSALEPGDLVFYGAPAYHVALYIGGGRIIQAPHTGADVEIASVGSATSAGRP